MSFTEMSEDQKAYRRALELPEDGPLSPEQILQAFHAIALERLCNYTLDDLRELARIRDALLASWTER